MRLALPALALLLLCGCGGGAAAAPGHDPRARPGSSGDVEVVRSWAATLRRGDVEGASRLFSVPSRVANGTPLLTLRSRDEVRTFNRALPCGARLLSATPHHGYLIARFELVDRRGPGAVRPCAGKGAEAATAFRIVHGRIAEWRRVPTPTEDVPPAATNPV